MQESSNDEVVDLMLNNPFPDSDEPLDVGVYNPGYLKMPDWADSNLTYKFVTPDGREFDIVWVEINERFEIAPF